jgi:ankyrin repeat protein
MSKEEFDRAWAAVQFDNIAVVEELVPSVVAVNASTCNPNNHIHTLLQCAGAHGSAESAAYLLKNGAKVNAKNFAGYTALHWAARSGRTETLALLLENGADIEARTEDGITPLHLASHRGHLNFVLALVDAHADLEAVASNGWNALYFTVVSNQKKVAEKLVELGLTADIPDSQGKTILDLVEKYQREWGRELFKT